MPTNFASMIFEIFKKYSLKILVSIATNRKKCLDIASLDCIPFKIFKRWISINIFGCYGKQKHLQKSYSQIPHVQNFRYFLYKYYLNLIDDPQVSIDPAPMCFWFICVDLPINIYLAWPLTHHITVENVCKCTRELIILAMFYSSIMYW